MRASLRYVEQCPLDPAWRLYQSSALRLLRIPHRRPSRTLVFHSGPCSNRALRNGGRRSAIRSLFSTTTSVPRVEGLASPEPDIRPPDEVRNTNDDVLRSILTRARPYGIMTVGDLVYQSTLDHHLHEGKLLLSGSKYRNDLELWSVLLDFQQLQSGDPGVVRLWHVLKDRAGRTEAFFTSPKSDYFWKALIAVGIKDTDFLERICTHEAQHGALRPTFYRDVVGVLLADQQIQEARRFSRLLQPAHPVDLDDMHQLFLQACASTSVGALEDFCEVYSTVPRLQMYGGIVRYLCEVDRHVEALMTHRRLLELGDFPPSFDSMRPLLQFVIRNDLDWTSILASLQSAGIRYEHEVRNLVAEEKSLRYGVSSDNLNIVSSRTLGVKPQRLSDQFVARAFATTTFSFGFVLAGLHMMGLQEIGPLAMRQIGLHAGEPTDVCERLGKLNDLGIDTGSSTFTRVVIQCAHRDQAALLSDILQSDQHPDVFEDNELQEKLLAQYYRQKDWRQADRTLAILSIGDWECARREHLSEAEMLFNLRVRAATRALDRRGVSRLMAEARTQRWHLSKRSLRCMHDTILPTRNPTHEPSVREGYDDLGFLINLWQGAAEVGSHVAPTFWREPVRRLGMLGRWQDLERLLFWLAAAYSPQNQPTQARPLSRPRQSSDGIANTSAKPCDMLARMFTTPLQSAIVAWPFLPKTSKHHPGPPRRTFPWLDVDKARETAPPWHWLRGVEILRTLRDEYNVSVSTSAVRAVCLQRLRILFAPAYSSTSYTNDRLRVQNKPPLEKCLHMLDKAWGDEPLFPDSPPDKTTYETILRPRKPRPRDSNRLEKVRGALRDRAESRSLAILRRARLQDSPSQSGQSDQPPALQHSDLVQPAPPRTHGGGSSRVATATPIDEPEQAAMMSDVIVYRDVFTASWEDYAVVEEKTTTTTTTTKTTTKTKKKQQQS